MWVIILPEHSIKTGKLFVLGVPDMKIVISVFCLHLSNFKKDMSEFEYETSAGTNLALGRPYSQ